MVAEQILLVLASSDTYTTHIQQKTMLYYAALYYILPYSTLLMCIVVKAHLDDYILLFSGVPNGFETRIPN